MLFSTSNAVAFFYENRMVTHVYGTHIPICRKIGGSTCSQKLYSWFDLSIFLWNCCIRLVRLNHFKSIWRFHFMKFIGSRWQVKEYFTYLVISSTISNRSNWILNCFRQLNGEAHVSQVKAYAFRIFIHCVHYHSCAVQQYIYTHATDTSNYQRKFN